jgi:predicted phage terminase large subunit-like protein
VITATERPSVDQAVALAVRDSFTAFSRFAWAGYEHKPHLELIDRALTQVVRYVETRGVEGIGNLIIEMPPRHGKSKKVSQLFPAWFLGRNPDKRVIMASYGQDLATVNSRQVRAIVNQKRFEQVFGIKLAADSKAKDVWDIADHEGGLLSVGKGGGMVGRGAHVAITDDLVKNRKEAESQHQRDMDWDWWVNDLLTRKQPGAAHISVMTRWNRDDVHGRIELLQAGKWTWLRLPALAEKNDPMGRAEGDALCPDWYSREYLLDIKADQGEYPFAALYQQHPISKEGGLFKTANLIVIDEVPTDIVRIVRYWDLAMSSKQSADYTVGVAMGLTKTGSIVVLDVQRFQKEWDEVPGEIKKIAQMDGPKVLIGVESVFFQSRAVAQLARDPELFSFSIKGFAVESDKVTRALPLAARVGMRQVFVMRRAWATGYIDEMTAFNKGAHDDQVDASSGAFAMLERKPVVATTQRYA